MMAQQVVPQPVWQLRWDVASTLALVWLVNPVGNRTLRPEVHLFLADRYGRLARHHQGLGHTKRALELERKAERHCGLGGWFEPPPAVAVAMPQRGPAVALDAVARAEPWKPDNAA
jgi:hypothetical protein